MRPFLLKLHYYVAFIFLLPLVIAGATGMVLVFDHALDESFAPSMLLSDLAPLTDRHAIDFDRAIAAASTQMEAGERVSRVFVPRHNGAAILAETRGNPAGAREVWVNPQSYHVQGTRLRDGHVMRWIYELHSHLLMNPAGHYIVLANAAVLALLCITGIVNWLRHPSPRLQLRVKRKIFLRWWDTHRLVGAVAAVLLLLIAASGGTMAFMHSFGKSLREKPQTPAVSHTTTPLSVDEMITLGAHTFPDGKVTTVFPPSSPQQPWKISWKQPDEPRTSKGVSHVWIDPYAAAVLHVDNPLKRTGWGKWLVWAFPLHNGEWAGLAMRWLHWLMGFALVLLAYTGTRSFLARRKKKPRNRRKMAL